MLQHGPGGPWPSQNFGWVGHNAFGPTNNWPVCSLILHCGQLILKKISKIGASRYQILRLKCTKFTFCWGSAPDPAGGAYSAARPLALSKRPNSKGMEGNGRGGRKGKGKGRGEVEGEPTQKFWCGAPYGVHAEFSHCGLQAMHIAALLTEEVRKRKLFYVDRIGTREERSGSRKEMKWIPKLKLLRRPCIALYTNIHDTFVPFMTCFLSFRLIFLLRFLHA